jgi:hypothetical protein
MHHLKFIQALEADTLMTENIKISSEAVYMKRFLKDRDGTAITISMINDMSTRGKDTNDQLYATGQAMKSLIKMALQKAV